MTAGLGNVGRSGKPSFPEHLFQEFRSGRIDKDTYETQTAIWVAENANKYEFRHYPQLSQDVVKYVSSRVGGVRDARDESFHRRVGGWVQAVRSNIEQNTSDHSLFLWCRELLLAKKLVKHVELLEQKSQEYMQLPPSILGVATRCLVMDSREKARSA